MNAGQEASHCVGYSKKEILKTYLIHLWESNVAFFQKLIQCYFCAQSFMVFSGSTLMEQLTASTLPRPLTLFRFCLSFSLSFSIVSVNTHASCHLFKSVGILYLLGSFSVEKCFWVEKHLAQFSSVKTNGSS